VSTAVDVGRKETAMATITRADLQIGRDDPNGLAMPYVTCRVNFNPEEMSIMNALPGVKVFELRCELWGGDGSSADDFLFLYPQKWDFADSTPSSSEPASFYATISQEKLDEDSSTWWGGGDDRDDIYGKLILDRVLFARTEVATAKTPERHGYF
jgi:hypothetical protein